MTDTRTARRWTVEVHVEEAMNLNQTLHMRVKSKRIAQIREAARDAVTAAGVPPLERFTAELHFIPKNRARRDPENWTPTSKAIVDGIVLAGVAPDDSPEYFTPRTPVMDPPRSTYDRSRYYVVITDGTAHQCTVPGCAHNEEITA